MAFLSALKRSGFRQAAAPPDPEPEANDAAPPPETADAAGAFDMIEEDLRRVRSTIGVATDGMGRAIDVAAADAAVIVTDADRLAETISVAHGNVETMSSAFAEIATAGDQITREIGSARGLAEEAQTGAQHAGAGVRELDSAIARIESVVDLIAKVARQTTLLALNATIEAERAGAAGRGFAVVASEVKALSVETQRATDEINANIASLQKAARHSIASVGEVVASIDRLTPSFIAVSDAVSRQGEIIGQAATLSDRTRVAVDEASERAGDMKSRSVAVAGGVSSVRVAADQLTATTEATTLRLMTVLRQTRAGDRRAHDRLPAFLPATIRVGDRDVATETVDISEGGVLLRNVDGGARVGDRTSVDIDRVGAIPARLVALSPLGLHVAFDGSAADHQGLVARVASIRAEYDTLIDRCMQTAAQVSQFFEAAIGTGEISAEALFDTEYKAIPGTDPEQFETPALPFLERVLQPMQEQLLASDARMAFCAAVDRNGFLPVHNLVFSKPQRPGDRLWNTANCRNRRIFDDRAGLTAARNTRPFL
ncbi:MAG TPA: methyl-accepting chemotaxis protein, partial [Methylomirabilota bacterium]|nr:methyl-accepting chemotaxis protein [Methylomirabilota bacterium]